MDASTGSEPLAGPDADSLPFFAAAERGELLLQHCAVCANYQWPGSPRCHNCFADARQWRPAARAGTVYSYTVVHRAVHPAFADAVPYVLVTVDLREGVRITLPLLDVTSEQVQIGAAVAIAFQAMHGSTLPVARLSEATLRDATQ